MTARSLERLAMPLDGAGSAQVKQAATMMLGNEQHCEVLPQPTPATGGEAQQQLVRHAYGCA